MGVDYYNCSICGVIFNDCGSFGYCDNCENMLCDDCHEAQVEKYGEVGEKGENRYGEGAAAKCDLCSGAIISDSDIIAFLLGKAGTTREDVVASIQKERGIEVNP